MSSGTLLQCSCPRSSASSRSGLSTALTTESCRPLRRCNCASFSRLIPASLNTSVGSSSFASKQGRTRGGVAVSAVSVEKGIHSPATVEELMNPDVVTVNEDTLIRDAVKLFLDHRISGAPVLDPNGNLVGIISESDIMWKEVGVPDDNWLIQPTFIGFADLVVAFRDDKKFKSELQKVLARTVGEAMTRNPVTVAPNVTAQEAASLMLHKKVTRLPVLEDGKLAGVLTRSDIMRGMLLNDEL